MHVDSFLEAPSSSDRRLRFAISASVVVALLFAMASLGGLLVPSLYARETENWATQALAQDWFDLVVAAPALLLAATRAARGSRRAQLVLAGLLLFAIYTLLIYAFAVHLNALFLVYCAGLGLAIYALISLGRSVAPTYVRTWFAPGAPRRLAGGFLIAIGAVFGLLWLAQLVPAAITGRDPAELVETGLLTNPIHVIDISFILPLHVLAGVLWWRRRSLGYVLGPIMLVFGTFMSASIGFLIVVMQHRGVASGMYPIAIAMAVVAMSTLALTFRTLDNVRE